MKTIELSTSLIGISGMFCTYWGNGNPNDLFSGSDYLEEDFNNGDSDIHPDYADWHWDNKAYMKVWNEAVLTVTEDLLNNVFEHFELEGVKFISGDYYSPREYNFSGDSSNFDLEIPDNLLLKLLTSVDKDSLEDHLINEYSSRDGFISFTPNNLKDLLEEIEEDPSRCWGALISYLVTEYIEDEDCREDLVYDFIEEIRTNHGYTCFVDTTELDEFQEEVCPIVDCEWKEALFARDFLRYGNHKETILNEYGKGSSVEEVAKNLQKYAEKMAYVEVEVIEGFVRKIFSEIDANTMKLDI